MCFANKLCIALFAKRVENTPPMVLQIRFAIWLTLQIEVEALHICKPSHHFAFTISVLHVGLRPSAPPRAISLHPSALPAARAHPPAAARAHRPIPPAAAGAKTWAGRQLAATWPRR